MKSFIGKLFNRKTGELEVITVRTPSGEYDHHATITGTTQFSKEDIEELERRNVEEYNYVTRRLDGSLFVSNVTSFIKNYLQGNESGIYSRVEKRKQPL
jgi:hypothetical protein